MTALLQNCHSHPIAIHIQLPFNGHNAKDEDLRRYLSQIPFPFLTLGATAIAQATQAIALNSLQ
ncbi:MAG TPA: hypothetical protein V6C57_10595 [Coleofasciculaceae cyanobacterium]